MNKIIQSLNEIIHQDLIIPKTPIIEIRENSKNATGQFVKIKTKNKVFAFSLDKPPKDNFPFFKPKEGYKKCCDLILFMEQDEKKYVILGDLKSGSPKKSDIVKQLKASYNFINYLKNMMDLNENFKVELIEKYCIFQTRKTSQKTISRNRDNCTEYKGMKIKFLKANNEIPYELKALI